MGCQLELFFIQHRFFKFFLGTPVGSLESDKIIVGSLQSEKIGSLESEKSGPYMSIPGAKHFP